MKHFLPFLALLASASAVHAQDKKAALREISADYEQIESNYKTWPHYSVTLENLEGGHSYTNQLWMSGDGDDQLSKLEAQNFGDHGESKLQFFFRGDRLLFSLDRREDAIIEPAATDVMEQRYYFADNKLIRLLKKQGRFSAGKPTDTTSLKNREQPLDVQAPGDESPEETYRNQHEIAAPLMLKLRRLNADEDVPPAPGAEVPAKTPWRVIAGSTSRDGTQALAWGLKGRLVPEGEAGEDGTYQAEEDDKDLVNYIVNLTDKTVIGAIEGRHFGDKATYNHSTTQTTWSLVGDFVAQVNSGKWATYDAFVYPTQSGNDGNAPIKGADLLATVKKAAQKKLKGEKSLKGHDVADFSITLNEVAITGAGDSTRLWVDVTGQIPKDEEGGGFDCSVTFKLAANENGGPPKLTLLSLESH